jgi:hypothetical protein
MTLLEIKEQLTKELDEVFKRCDGAMKENPFSIHSSTLLGQSVGLIKALNIVERGLKE